MAKTLLIEIRDNKEEILEVASNTATILRNENMINITEEQIIPTIVCSFFENLSEYLAKNKVNNGAVEINFMDLIKFGISHRENEEAEKEGNFTPYIKPGQGFETILNNSVEEQE